MSAREPFANYRPLTNKIERRGNMSKSYSYDLLTHLFLLKPEVDKDMGRDMLRCSLSIAHSSNSLNTMQFLGACKVLGNDMDQQLAAKFDPLGHGDSKIVIWGVIRVATFR